MDIRNGNPFGFIYQRTGGSAHSVEPFQIKRFSPGHPNADYSCQKLAYPHREYARSHTDPADFIRTLRCVLRLPQQNGVIRCVSVSCTDTRGIIRVERKG